MNSAYLKSLGPESKRYVDDKGNIKNPSGDVYVYDAGSNLIATSAKPRVPVRAGKLQATTEELLNLKHAILNDSDKSFEKQFKQAVALVDSASSYDGEESHELLALRWCWNVLYWRPRRNKMTVFKKNPNNPYVK